MGKKKKKNRSKKHPSSGSNPARKAADHLTAGRFRQAVDVYKKLCRTDRDGFLAPLRAAYEGLCRQRLEKGLFEEAAMVIDQLEKLSGAAALKERIALHLKREDFPKAAEVAASALSAGSRCADKEAAAAADALVAAFAPTPAENRLPDSVRGDLDRIRSALEEVAGGRCREALERIKPIGMRSIFASWKWFIKGLCAFYGRKDERAVAAFEKIAPDTAPAAAAAPYLRLLQQDRPWDADAKDSRLMADVCLVAGFAETAADLARAQYLWTVKRYRDSHAHLRNKMAGFPTCSGGLARSLSELYYNSCFEMAPDTAGKYVAHIARSAFSERAGNPTEQVWAQRSMALLSEELEDCDPYILELWEKFIDLYESLNGESPRARSLVYGRLGDLFAAEMPDDNPFSLLFPVRRRRQPVLRNEQLARHCFEESVGADPEALPPQLAQVAFFEKVGDTPQVNRLLDRLIRQFPDEKEILCKAGVRCTDRKAFTKAMKYLERALVLDPMDKGLREHFIVACIRAARQYVQKHKPEKVRALLARALEWSDAHSDDFNRGRAYLYARWTALAHLLRDETAARQNWSQAAAQAQGSELKLHFFYWIVARAYGVARSLLTESNAVVEKALKGAFHPETALDCIAILQYASLLSDTIGGLPQKAARVERYLARGASAQITRLQAGAIVGFTLSETCRRPDIAEDYVARMLARRPDDALFRYYRYLLRTGAPRWYRATDADRKELTRILQLAQEQREAAVTPAVQELLRDMDAMSQAPFLDIDDDIDEEEIEEDDSFFPVFEPPPKRRKPEPQKDEGKSRPPKPQQLNLF